MWPKTKESHGTSLPLFHSCLSHSFEISKLRIFLKLKGWSIRRPLFFAAIHRLPSISAPFSPSPTSACRSPSLGHTVNISLCAAVSKSASPPCLPLIPSLLSCHGSHGITGGDASRLSRSFLSHSHRRLASPSIVVADHPALPLLSGRCSAVAPFLSLLFHRCSVAVIGCTQPPPSPQCSVFGVAARRWSRRHGCAYTASSLLSPAAADACSAR